MLQTARPVAILASGPVGTGCIQELSGHRPYLAPGDSVRIEIQHLGAIIARITEREDHHHGA
ncbi:hypothetical protein AB0M05_32325 [Streptomyces violaceusniger]|uniref:hypothetical protein n=1 Tax=Streptomyces violaceusniger TaxID=68280 RepID=UPI003445CAC8